MNVSQKQKNYIVSDLKPLKNHLYEITVDSNTYRLHEETILKYRLVKGKEFTDLEKIISDNDNNILYAKIEAYVLRYPKSSRDLKAYLINKYELDSSLASDIILKLKAKGILNDDAFRDALVEGLKRKGYGKKYIEAALHSKGLEMPLDFTLDNDQLDRVIEKKLRGLKNAEGPKKKEKLISHLLRKGYSYNDIKDKISNYL